MKTLALLLAALTACSNPTLVCESSPDAGDASGDLSSDAGLGEALEDASGAVDHDAAPTALSTVTYAVTRSRAGTCPAGEPVTSLEWAVSFYAPDGSNLRERAHLQINASSFSPSSATEGLYAALDGSELSTEHWTLHGQDALGGFTIVGNLTRMGLDVVTYLGVELRDAWPECEWRVIAERL